MDYKTGRDIVESLSEISTSLSEMNQRLGELQQTVANMNDDGIILVSKSEIEHYKKRTEVNDIEGS